MNALIPREAARNAVVAHTGRPATATVIDTPDVRAIVFRLSPGQAVPPHRNASTVLLTVLEGEGTLSGEENGVPVDRTCTAGDMIVYAPNELHAMRADTTELLLLATITPRPGERNALGHMSAGQAIGGSR
jgi:quercetin dioxygenase-like cupin family protein